MRSPKGFMIVNLALAVGAYAYLSRHFDVQTPYTWAIGAFALLSLYVIGRVANGYNKIHVIESVRTLCFMISVQLIFNNIIWTLSFGSAMFFGNYLLLNFNLVKSLMFFNPTHSSE